MTPYDILQNHFGYNKFKDGQLEIINNILSGKNMLAVLPTGGGKSLCYQIPALLTKRLSIVVSPLIALMKDQVDNINKDVEVAAFINSSLSEFENSRVTNKLFNKSINLLYVAPERLENQFFLEQLRNLNPKYLFVDEAHCISEWGHNFRPSYRRIVNLIEYLDFENIAAFTATATPEVRNDITTQLKMNDASIIVRGFERKNLSIRVKHTNNKKKNVSDLLINNQSPSIVYVPTRKEAESIDNYLKLKGLSSNYYHAGLSQSMRKLVQDDFISERINTIVATNAFGMGIDKSNIRTIIHTSITGSIENYYQEIGRAGRDESDSKIFLLFNQKDVELQNYFINSSFPSKDEIKSTYELICNFAGIALGSKNISPIPISKNLFDTLKLKSISKAIFFASLKVLSQSGYIEFIENVVNTFSIKILMSKVRLKKFIESSSNKNIQNLLIATLRVFGSKVFSGMVKFKLPILTNESKIPEQSVLDGLRFLNDTGIIEFIEPSLSKHYSLITTRIPISDLRINYKTIIDQKQNAKDKLECMIDFCYTKQCRFEYILDYFGEHRKYNCGNCDNCIGEHSENYNEFIVSQIIDTLQHSSKGMNSKDLVKLLIGKSNHPGIKLFSTFSSCEHYSKKDIISNINFAEARGQIKKTNEYLTIGDEVIKLATNPAPVNEVSSNLDLNLYNQLREMRLQASRKYSQTPEIICSENFLKDIAIKKPKNKTDFLSISGSSNKVYIKIGKECIDLIEQFQKLNNSVDTTLPSNLKNVYNLVKKNYSLSEICSISKLPEALVSMQIETIVKFDKDCEIKNLFNQKEIGLIKEQIDLGVKKLKSLKAALPNSISYAKIRIVLAKNKST